MKHKNTISILILCIVILALIATIMGIFSDSGPGPYEYESIRGHTVLIYGKGLYKDMSAEVAPQGIAQDVVTLSIGIPLLLISLFFSRKGSLKGRFLLAGTLGYFLVTYLFYTVMGMYNVLFLGYVLLLSASFFAFALTMSSLNIEHLHACFNQATPVKFVGGFLLFNAIAIALLWLSIIIPPLVSGTIVPLEAAHYTTLIVQGLDLGILLPLAFLSGVLFIKKRPFGFLLAPVYIIFLSILMTALTAKVIAMSLMGANVIPAAIIIPLFNVIAILCSFLLLRHIDEPEWSERHVAYRQSHL